ncbi:MAG: hypothetical protein ACLRMZ_06285 [Blautia marasmi]
MITLFVLVLPFAAYVPVGVLVAVSLGTGVLSTLFTNICLAMTPEANVARNASGTAMGLYAAIAYAPDLSNIPCSATGWINTGIRDISICLYLPWFF